MNARVLTTFRFYQLFRGVDFAGAIWVPFLLERGFSLPQVGLIEAVLHVGMLGAQIPTGALADTLGRRRMLVAAGFFTAVAQLGWVYAPGLVGVCCAALVAGVSFALVMGSDEAYLFDALRTTTPRRTSRACWAACGPYSSSPRRSRSSSAATSPTRSRVSWPSA